MTQNLTHQVAQALNRDPEEILMVKPYTTHINVIFTDYRKTAVSLTDLPTEEEKSEPAKQDPVIISDSADELHLTVTDAPVLNDEYQQILQNPHMFDRDQLRQLAAELRISNAATLNKKPLVTAINQWKRENQA